MNQSNGIGVRSRKHQSEITFEIRPPILPRVRLAILSFEQEFCYFFTKITSDTISGDKVDLKGTTFLHLLRLIITLSD